jgi:Ca2+-binding EF-hand superfamily protein
MVLFFCAWQDEGQGGDAKAKQKKKTFVDMVLGGTDKFIERFDKNKDGFLTTDELPPCSVKQFERFDRNKDGKLNRAEVESMLDDFRLLLEKQGAVPAGAAVERLVDMLLSQMDSDKDGKLSKEEARGQAAKLFAILDVNKDGFLDRSELLALARQILAARQAEPLMDFDSFDKNADGRLTRNEVKGTVLEAVFDEIDANRDGRITPTVFAAYLRRLAVKKKTD